MEALGLRPLHTLRISHSNSNFSKQRLTHYGTTSELSSPQLRPSHRTHHFQWGAIRMIADSEVYELKQMKDMSAARKRWEALVRKENVKVFTPREAGYAIQLSKKTLPDVRPSTERKKAWVKGSTWIPVFDVDYTLDAGTIPRKFSSFVMGGWWSGVPMLSYDCEIRTTEVLWNTCAGILSCIFIFFPSNRQFLSKVGEKFPKDTDLIVACQKGPRSLGACELLYNAGYRNLFWVQGDLEAAEDEDLVTEGPEPLKFAGLGGLSEFLGWTVQQRDAA